MGLEDEQVYATHGDWTLNPVLWSIYDNFNLFVGLVIIICFWPYLIVQMGLSTIWEWLDKHTINLIVFCKWMVNNYLSPFFGRFTRHPSDGFMIVYAIWLGVVIPAYFFLELWNTRTNGFSMWNAVIFNLFRIGPIYMNFMNVYVMCHKEAHLTPGGIFPSDSILHTLFNRWFNHWVGLFQGLIPGGFTYSHILGHHKYDNDYRDVVTTAYRSRDSFINFIKYMSDWFYYSCNITVALQFYREHRWTLLFKTVLCSLYHASFLYFCYIVSNKSLPFIFWFCIYPYVEANVLLAIVNVVWHAFIDEREPANDFINSTTIVNGANFTLQEEYHVVHHQFPGLHWTRHEEMYEKVKSEYFRPDMPGTILVNENVFVVFIYIVTKSYDKIADLYHPDVKMDRKELVELLKKRLRTCGHAIARQTGRQHKTTAPKSD